MERPTFHFFIALHTQQVVVVVFKVMEDDGHAGLVQFYFVVAVSTHNTTKLTIDVVMVGVFIKGEKNGVEQS